jgi:hypothetical protein
MNSVAPDLRAISTNTLYSSGSSSNITSSPELLLRGGRGKSVGSVSSSGRPASVSVQNGS